MKKLLVCILALTLMMPCLASCALFLYRESEWFSEDTLAECFVPDLPEVDCNYLRKNDKDIYVKFTEAEFNAYLNSVYTYLKSLNFKYLGTRGERASSRSGAFTTDFLKPADQLS